MRNNYNYYTMASSRCFFVRSPPDKPSIARRKWQHKIYNGNRRIHQMDKWLHEGKGKQKVRKRANAFNYYMCKKY